MFKLSQLLQSIDKFYHQTIQSYLNVKYAAESYVSPDDESEDNFSSTSNPLDTLENIWDKINNPQLADQI